MKKGVILSIVALLLFGGVYGKTVDASTHCDIPQVSVKKIETFSQEDQKNGGKMVEGVKKEGLSQEGIKKLILSISERKKKQLQSSSGFPSQTVNITRIDATLAALYQEYSKQCQKSNVIALPKVGIEEDHTFIMGPIGIDELKVSLHYSYDYRSYDMVEPNAEVQFTYQYVPNFSPAPLRVMKKYSFMTKGGSIIIGADEKYKLPYKGKYKYAFTSKKGKVLHTGTFNTNNSSKIAPYYNEYWDIDNSDTLDSSVDGDLIMRYLFGFKSSNLTKGIFLLKRKSPSQIEQYISKLNLDIDGNGKEDALSDGLLFKRFLLGYTGDNLVSGAIGKGAIRKTPEEIIEFIKKPTPKINVCPVHDIIFPIPEGCEYIKKQSINGCSVSELICKPKEEFIFGAGSWDGDSYYINYKYPDEVVFSYYAVLPTGAAGYTYKLTANNGSIALGGNQKYKIDTDLPYKFQFSTKEGKLLYAGEIKLEKSCPITAIPKPAPGCEYDRDEDENGCYTYNLFCETKAEHIFDMGNTTVEDDMVTMNYYYGYKENNKIDTGRSIVFSYGQIESPTILSNKQFKFTNSSREIKIGPNEKYKIQGEGMYAYIFSTQDGKMLYKGTFTIKKKGNNHVFDMGGITMKDDVLTIGYYYGYRRDNQVDTNKQLIFRYQYNGSYLGQQYRFTAPGPNPSGSREIVLGPNEKYKIKNKGKYKFSFATFAGEEVYSGEFEVK